MSYSRRRFGSIQSVLVADAGASDPAPEGPGGNKACVVGGGRAPWNRTAWIRLRRCAWKPSGIFWFSSN